MDWVYVEDVVDALLASSIEPDAPGKVLDIGSGSVHSIRDAVTLIAEVVETDVAPGFGRLPDRAKERDLVADIRPATLHLGWQPGVDLGTGIALTVEWHLEQAGRPTADSVAPGPR